MNDYTANKYPQGYSCGGVGNPSYQPTQQRMRWGVKSVKAGHRDRAKIEVLTGVRRCPWYGVLSDR
jgi:hypothetical protein